MPRLIFASLTKSGFRGIGATIYAAMTVSTTMAMKRVRVSWPISSPEIETLPSVRLRPGWGRGALRGSALLFLRLGLGLPFRGAGGFDEACDRGLAHPDADVLAFVDAEGEVLIFRLDLLDDAVESGGRQHMVVL